MMNSFGKHLQALRNERGMSISYLSQGTGISRKSIHRWEEGVNAPKSFTTIMLLADFFQVSPDAFFRDDNRDLREEVRKLREEIADLRRYIKGEGTSS